MLQWFRGRRAQPGAKLPILYGFLRSILLVLRAKENQFPLKKSTSPHRSIHPNFGVHGDHKQVGGPEADGARHEPKAEGGGAHVAEVEHARDAARELQLGRVVEGVG